MKINLKSNCNYSDISKGSGYLGPKEPMVELILEYLRI